MPTYEYDCPECGEIVEIIHGVNEKPPRTCPACGERAKLTKRLSAPAFQFKGSGWYITDYARKKGEKGKAKEKESSGESSSSSTADSGSGGEKAGSKADKKADSAD